MATIFLRHPVADYAAWRPHYDADGDRRDSAGVTEVGVFRNADDPNDVLMVWTAEDTSAIKAIVAGDDDLKELMKEAGVTGPPEMYIVE